MLPQLGQYITLPIKDFCSISRLGDTTVRQMVKDGQLQAARIGKKRLMIVVQSYLDFLAKQQAEGVPEYDVAQKARATRMANHEARQRGKPGVDLGDLDLL